MESTTIHTYFNVKEIRLGAVYKSPAKKLLNTDLDNLFNTEVNTIFGLRFKREKSHLA